MLRLRADPWMPDYGMGFDVAVDDEEAPATADPFVESEDWSRPRRPRSTQVQETCVSFVDGVRRAEVRLVADQDGQRALGLFGTYAAGAVRCLGRAAFADMFLGRAVVLGSGLAPERVLLNCGRSELTFEPVTEPGSEPADPLLRLQRLMRDAEAAVASRLASTSDSALVLCDGPLGFLERKTVPVVGVIKRFARLYLDAPQGQLLTRLGPGERTPLFGIVDVAGRTRLYAWYVRLVSLRAPWHDHAGLVRCEVSALVGLEAAAHVADQVTAILPQFAGRPSDPRAPQNLAPVAGLETWLRHRMGDPLLIRRALLSYLCAPVASEVTL